MAITMVAVLSQIGMSSTVTRGADIPGRSPRRTLSAS
jgi:hypothetical protein